MFSYERPDDSLNTGFAPSSSFQRAEFSQAFPAVLEALINQFGIDCSTRQLAPGIHATFDGASITLDSNLELTQKVFLSLHLFGHAVQWGLLAGPPLLAAKAYDIANDPALEQRVVEYEVEASQYAAQLLIDLGLVRLVPWFAEMAQADRDYFLNFCRTGSIDKLESFIRPLRSPLIPKLIPSFSPQRAAMVEIV